MATLLIGSFNAGTAVTGPAAPNTPMAPCNIQAIDTSPSGSYDSSGVTVQGSVDKRSWKTLATFTADGDVIAVPTLYQYFRGIEAGDGTAGRLLEVVAAQLD